MVKSKKLSRGSLAVLLLALLLGISMIVGITGAWFTDGIHKAGEVPSKGFGTLKLGDVVSTEYASEGWTQLSTNSAKLIPGSTVAVSGGKIENAGNVDLYVKFDVLTTILINGAEYATDRGVTHENGVAVVGAKTLQNYIEQSKLRLNTEAASGRVVAAQSGTGWGEGIYKLQAQCADPAVAKERLDLLGFNVTLTGALPNSLTLAAVGTQGQDGYLPAVELKFNENASAAIAINYYMVAVAVQADNITPAQATTALDAMLATAVANQALAVGNQNWSYELPPVA